MANPVPVPRKPPNALFIVLFFPLTREPRRHPLDASRTVIGQTPGAATRTGAGHRADIDRRHGFAQSERFRATIASQPMTTAPRHNLADTVYTRLRDDLFEFRLLPGDRFTETEVAQRLGVSRTPVRQALFRLEREGHVEVASRNGWRVLPLDFDRYDQLYDVRLILELAAVQRLCVQDPIPDLQELQQVWLVAPTEREREPQTVARLDESFHETLMTATGNRELARIFHDVTERIRIIRRLDFTQPERIQQTYDEHAQILRTVLARRPEQAMLLLRSHIDTSKAEVKKITLHRLHQARREV